MKKIHLNGWQRFGIIASVLWFFIAGWKANETSRIVTSDAYDACVQRVNSSPRCPPARSHPRPEAG